MFTFQVLSGKYCSPSGQVFVRGDVFQTEEPLHLKFQNQFLQVAHSGVLPVADVVKTSHTPQPATPATPAAPAKQTKAAPPQKPAHAPLPEAQQTKDIGTDNTSLFLTTEEAITRGIEVRTLPTGGFNVVERGTGVPLNEEVLPSRKDVRDFLGSLHNAPAV